MQINRPIIDELMPITELYTLHDAHLYITIMTYVLVHTQHSLAHERCGKQRD